jgi:hypothetical protein
MKAAKYKSTIVLLLAVAIAGVVAYSLSKKPTSEELERQRKRLLPDFKTADVVSLVIESGGKRFACRRGDNDEWRLTEPVAVRADRAQVEDILDKLELAEKVSAAYPEKGKPLDLAQYGLKEPVRKVAVEVSGAPARTWTILVGKEAGAADSVFVMVEGQAGVYAVGKDVVQKTSAALTDLRSKNLVAPLGTFDLTKVTIASAALNGRAPFEAECEKAGDKWEVKKPFYGPADSDQIAGLADKLHSHRIGTGDFVVDDPTKAGDYGLDKPTLTLTLEGAGKTQTVLFSRRQEGDAVHCYAMEKGELPIVRVPESLLNDLLKQPDDLRDRSLARFVADDVKQATIAGPGAKLELAKDGEKWRIGGDKPAAADTEVIGKLLANLRNAKVQAFVADKPDGLDPYGLAEAQRTLVTLRKADGSELCSIALGKANEAGDSVYALRNPYPAVLALKKESYVDAIGTGRLAFLDRLVLDEPQADAVEIVTDGKAGHFRCEWTAKDARWDLLEPVHGMADQAALQAVVGDFSRLRAESFAAEKADDLAPYGLKEPTATVSVTYQAWTPKPEGAGEGAKAPAPRVRTLFIGSAAQPPAKSSYARMADGERVFTLPDYVVSQFQANAASKEICEASGLRALTLHKGDRTLKFTYDSEKRQWADAEGKLLAADLAAAVAGAAGLLESFRAVAVADYTEKSPEAYGFDKPYLTVDLDERTAKGKHLVIGGETEDGNRYAKGPATSFVHMAGKADVEKLDAVFRPAEAAPATEVAPPTEPAPAPPAPAQR